MTANDLSIRRSVVIGRLTNLGLAVLGLLIVHETAYSAATWLHPLIAGDGGSSVDHGHQSLLTATAGPLALWVTAWFVLRQVRQYDLGIGMSRAGNVWEGRTLAAAIAALYLVQESIEILAAGPGGPGAAGLIDNRAIVIGLVLAPLVGRILDRLLERAEELVDAWLADAGPRSTAVAVAFPVPTTTTVGCGIVHVPGDPRGPPSRRYDLRSHVLVTSRKDNSCTDPDGSRWRRRSPSSQP